jgi:hypothetical protein
VRFAIEQRLRAPLEQVEAAFVDPAFLERLAELPKLGRPQLLEQHAEGDVVHQDVRYSFAGDLNAAARRVVDPNRLSWIERSTLDRRTHRTAIEILPDNYADRLACSGSIQLRPEGDDSSVRIFEGELTVRVLLVGKKVESAIVSGMREHAELEARIVERWVNERAQ